jgi:hypothetical protein
MMDELRELLNKGGEKVFSRYNVEIGDALWTALYNHIEANLAEMTIEGVFEDEQVFAVLKNGEEYVKLNCSLNAETNEYSFAEDTEVIEYTPEEEPQFSTEAIAEYKAKKEEEKRPKKINLKKIILIMIQKKSALSVESQRMNALVRMKKTIRRKRKSIILKKLKNILN